MYGKIYITRSDNIDFYLDVFFIKRGKHMIRHDIVKTGKVLKPRGGMSFKGEIF